MLAACLIVLGLTSSAFAAEPTYTYIRGDPKGPEKWAELFDTCSGSSQSPINFDKVEQKLKASWALTNWESNSTWTVKNEGKTIQFDVNSSEAITTSGGGLPGAYTVAQFHFHWGGSGEKGSEHTVMGKSYPLEVHVVHYKSSFGNLSAAAVSGDSDALAVVGLFFESQEADNADLAMVIDSGVAQVQNYSDTVSINFSLNKIAGDALDGQWFRYNGGLTTPGCNEIVTWTVFATPVKIGVTQLAQFRSASTGNYGTELYRPVELQNDRTVYRYVDKISGSATFTLSMLSMLFTAMAIIY